MLVFPLHMLELSKLSVRKSKGDGQLQNPVVPEVLFRGVDRLLIHERIKASSPVVSTGTVRTGSGKKEEAARLQPRKLTASYASRLSRMRLHSPAHLPGLSKLTGYKLDLCFFREAWSDGLLGVWAVPRGFLRLKPPLSPFRG